MGGKICPFDNYNFKEIWDYSGDISYKNYDITYGTLKGVIYIIESDYKKEIKINGSLRKKNEKIQFNLSGKESYKYNDKNEVIVFKIDNSFSSGLSFVSDLKMTKANKDNAKINCLLKEKDFILLLDLKLLLKQKKEKQKVVVNNYKYLLLKLTKPIDVISNSLCGMNNLINTCYINSSFQILIHIPEFIQIIIENNDFEDNVIEHINIIFKMIMKNYKEFKSIDPSIFVENFKINHSDYNNHSQKDSEMFLEELIWNINSELSILNEKRITYFLNTVTEKEKLFYEYITNEDEDTHYKINDLFYVCFVHEKKCKLCNYTTYYFDESVGLKLTFDNCDKFNQKKKIDLYTLVMDNYKNPIPIKSNYLCQKCNKCYNMLEVIRIAKLPKILIISLQKTNIENTKKIPWLVQYSPDLGIKEIVDIDLCQQGNCLYNLFAINNHSGYSPKSGHYYSTIYLDYLKSWFIFNDQSVNQISEDFPSPNDNNYILFYRQKKSRI